VGARKGGAARPSITLDQALAAFAAMGLEKPYDIALPQGPKGAFTATSRPPRVEETRTVYLDQYSGKILGDVGFAQYGPAAKAIEWGVHGHQGQEYGPVNRYIMLAGCIAIALLTISALGHVVEAAAKGLAWLRSIVLRSIRNQARGASG